jgi:hypothetical protein
MSDDIVNQLTLNFLISKSQLHKLNKKIKDDQAENRRTDKEIYGKRLHQLFEQLLDNNIPSDLLCDVKSGFDYFVDKSIYYFKTQDQNNKLVFEREEIREDIDYDKEEEEEEVEEEEVEEEEDEEDEKEDEKEDEDQQTQTEPSVKIQSLPLDWFQSVRQNYKQNHIIPRTKDVIIVGGSPTFRDSKKKI